MQDKYSGNLFILLLAVAMMLTWIILEMKKR